MPTNFRNHRHRDNDDWCDATPARAFECAAWLNGSQYRPANGLGKLNRCEKSLGIQVVIARLVDDPNLPVCTVFQAVASNPLCAFSSGPVHSAFEAERSREWMHRSQTSLHG